MNKKILNKKVLISIVVVVMLVVAALAVMYGYNLYEMMLRVHGMGGHG
jgi:hypothetical protein